MRILKETNHFLQIVLKSRDRQIEKRCVSKLEKQICVNQKDLIKSQKRHQATYFNAPRLQVESLTESASNWFQSCLSDRFLIYFHVSRKPKYGF